MTELEALHNLAKEPGATGGKAHLLADIVTNATAYVASVAREAAAKEAKRVLDAHRNGVVQNTNFDCCRELWPWFSRTFLNSNVVPEDGLGLRRVKYREKNVNYCPFCGAKL